LLNFSYHRQLQTFVSELNALYRREPSLYQIDDDFRGFEWIDFHDVESSVISFVRYAQNREDFIVFVCNFTPVPRSNYRIGVPKAGGYREILNSDAEMFGGSNMGNGGHVAAEPTASHGRPASVSLTLPPLAVIALKPE
jgi:1,4-alpha-glucan branching enzyme